MIVFIVILAGTISFLTSLWLIKNKDKFSLVDIPNVRSSHNKAMPRGGGAGIVLGVLIGLSGCYLTGILTINIKYLVVIAGFLAMALLGFFSDRFNISILIRIVLQILIAGIAAWFIGGPTSFDIAGCSFIVGYLGILLAILWLISITNFYNFMDGIDGLAAMQGVISGIGIAVMGMILKEKSLIPTGLVLAGAVGGFLFLNFPPAKIFMGDTGSYPLGFYIASFALIDKRLPVPIALILGVFIFDTVVTLIRRVIKKEEWFKAHKSHFYQRALRLGYSHLEVTSALSLITILLTAIACIYLKVSPVFQIAIIAMAIFLLTAPALSVTFKEKRKDSENVIDKT